MSQMDPPEDVIGTGLRARKKQRTREAIIREALALFHEVGYEHTTIADIAAAADIAPRTFFSYFASKEAVVFHDVDAVSVAFEQRLLGRSPGETAFDALRAWVVDWIERTDALAVEERRRRELIRTTPALRACDRTNLARFEALLARAVAVDLDVPVDSLRAHLVSAAAVAALEALGPREGDAPAPDVAHALAIMDEALVFLRGGLEALRAHPPAPAHGTASVAAGPAA